MRLETDETIESLFKTDAAKLWRSLFLATGSREVASDAVAEAFAQALRRGSDLRDPRRWVWSSAFRIAGREMQDRTQDYAFPELPEDPPEPVVDLVRALRTLTPHQQRAVILADYAGYPHREIAAILGSTTSAVGVHVHRARRKLRSLLEDDDA